MRFKLAFAAVIVVCLFILSLPGTAETNTVAIRGAASMLHLCQELLQLYHQEHPAASGAVNVADSIDLLPAGRNSIWQTVQALDKSRKEQLRQKFGSEARVIPIAIEGVVVIMNRSNPVAELTVNQLRSIFTGRLGNWKEVGGKDAPIHLYSTEALVGGSLFFSDFVLHGEDIDTTMRGFVAPKETEHAVADDRNGIGLIPLPAENDVAYPHIRKSADSPAVGATTENIRSLQYPLSTQVYWAIPIERSEAVSQLVRFTLSPRGQLVSEAAGYYPLSPAERTQLLATIDSAKAAGN